jgi:hypothetical protein
MKRLLCRIGVHLLRPDSVTGEAAWERCTCGRRAKAVWVG